MEVITKEIDRALDAGVYYAALVCALTLPNICSALELPSGDTKNETKVKYEEWCGKWLEPFPSKVHDTISLPYDKEIGRDLYQLRCGVVHQGRLGYPKRRYSRIVFTVPSPKVTTSHLNVIEDMLNLDIVLFCRDMKDAVSRWYKAKQHQKNVRANLPHLVQFREDVLAPYIVGVSGFA